jgi:hypothetical protein
MATEIRPNEGFGYRKGHLDERVYVVLTFEHMDETDGLVKYDVQLLGFYDGSEPWDGTDDFDDAPGWVVSYAGTLAPELISFANPDWKIVSAKEVKLPA